MPWILLTAVDVADPDSTKPFVENLQRYGLLPDPARKDGLPVGLTVASNPFTFGMDFVGVTCAACHVSELRYDGKAVRIDGAPNMLNLQLFYSEAVDALTGHDGRSGQAVAGAQAPGTARLRTLRGCRTIRPPGDSRRTTARTCCCTATGWMHGLN